MRAILGRHGPTGKPYSYAFLKDHKLVAPATLVAYLLKLELETESRTEGSDFESA